MHHQPLSTCEQCIALLGQHPQQFRRVQFLKKLAKISHNQKHQKSSLILYSLYCILHKYDYVQALEAVEKAQGVDEGSILSISISKLLRALLYTYIDKHRDSLTLLKQASSLLKSPDSISLEMKNHYKHIIPLIISNLNTSTGKKSFFKFFSQIYDELSKESSENQLNEEILFAVHSQIQLLKSQIDFLPTINNTKQTNLQKSISATKVTSKTVYPHDKANDYMGFAKSLSKEEKAVDNVRKMIQNNKLAKQTHTKSSSSLNKGLGFSKNPAFKTMLKQQPNPYQLNLYAQEKPHCQFI